MFKTEEQLVVNCIPHITEFFYKENVVVDMQMVREPRGLFGIPDLMLYNGKVISVEFKLKDWRRAMEQAFRYKCFSYESYVFLDNHYIARALKNIDEFEKYNIGLCGVDNDEIFVYFEPTEELPYSKVLEDKALTFFNQVE